MPKKRIAVMILGPLGDVINTTGIFRRLREVYNDSVISIITINRALPAIKGIPEVDNIYYLDESKKNYNKNIDTLKFGLSLRGKFDIVLVLDNSLRSALCAFLTGTKRRIGRGRELRELFLTDIIPYLKEEKNDEIPVSEHFSRVLKPLGIYQENMDTYFSYSPDDEKKVVELLKEKNIYGKKLIGFCPACFVPKKSLEINDIAEIILCLNKKCDYKVVIVGGKDISEIVQGLSEYKNLEYYDFTGQTSFTESAALIDKCSKFISVDTACMHLAFARKVPTTAIFFSRLYKKWGPKDLNNNALFLNKESKEIDVKEIVEKTIALPEKLENKPR